MINRIFDISFNKKFKKKLNNRIDDILKIGFLSNDKYVTLFEKKFSKFQGSKYCLTTTNGTSALEVVLRSINVKNKVVLLSTNTFIATALSVENAGGIPVPIDIDNSYQGMCPEKLKKAIKKYKKKIGALIIVHIGGLISPKIEQIVKISKSNNLPLIEDCAQAHFSTFNNKKAGSFGIAGTFSFYTTKCVTSGEGGCVVTNYKKIYEKIKRLRQFGVLKEDKDNHELFGSNFKLSEIQAAFLLTDLERSKIRVAKRNLIAKRYQKNFKNSEWLALKPENGNTSYYKQIIIGPVKRNILKKYLNKNKIQLTGGVYNIPIHKQKRYKKKFIHSDFPNANFFCDYHFCPPCFPEINFKQVDYISKKILKFKS